MGVELNIEHRRQCLGDGDLKGSRCTQPARTRHVGLHQHSDTAGEMRNVTGFKKREKDTSDVPNPGAGIKLLSEHGCGHELTIALIQCSERPLCCRHMIPTNRLNMDVLIAAWTDGH